MGKVCVYFLKKGREVLEVADSLLKGLRERGFEVTSHPKVGGIGSDELDLVKKDLDLVIALGGDGTILRAVRVFDVPVAGVKLGGRGILAGTDPEELDEFLDRLERGELVATDRMRIVVKFSGRASPPALNELVLLRREPTKTPTFEIESERFRIRQRMDGIVVSTPTGSTGHSLSLRGPVVLEGSGILVLTPIAPISGMPSLVMPFMELRLRADEPLYLIVDGQVSLEVERGEEVRVERGRPARLLGLRDEGFQQLHRLGF